jgi:hypothetical protein
MGYQCPHYAAESADPQKTSAQFLSFIRDYLTNGLASSRWGLKSLFQCRVTASLILNVWPETRWVVCIRDPIRSFESLRNTFDQNANYSLIKLAHEWCKAVLFGLFHPNATLVRFDQLGTADERHLRIAELFEFLEEGYWPEVREFVDQWPIIHKVVPDENRQFRFNSLEQEQLLTDCPLLSRLAQKLNYCLKVCP